MRTHSTTWPMAAAAFLLTGTVHASPSTSQTPPTTIVRAKIVGEVTPNRKRHLERTYGFKVIDSTSILDEYFVKIHPGTSAPPGVVAVGPILTKEKSPTAINQWQASKVLSARSGAERLCELTVRFFESAKGREPLLQSLGLQEVKGWTGTESSVYTALVPACTDGSLRQIAANLAGRDDVRFVKPGLVPSLAVSKIGRIIGAYQAHTQDLAPGFGHYRGHDKSVGIWDIHKVFDTHPDFAGRLIQGDGSSILEPLVEYLAPEAANHATLCAGVLAGSGQMSNGSLRGMAPDAAVATFNVLGAFMEMIWAAEPRDGSNFHHGIAAASNSWHFLGSNNQLGYFSDRTSDNFEVNTAALESLETVIVFAAGNNRACFNSMYSSICELNTIGDVGCNRFGLYPPGSQYGCLYNPADAKNIIVVGAVDSNLGTTVAPYSSFGPTRDGRIKPDVVAPGSNITTTSALNMPQLGYYRGGVNGTSMATPAVAGIAVQLSEHLDRLEAAQNRRILDRATLIKALLIHTAHDIETPGPDYKSGWGRVDVRSAIRLSSYSSNIIQDGFSDLDDQEAPKCFSLRMPAVPPNEFKATIVWMDTDPYDRPTSHPDGLQTEHPNYMNELNNDLDLTVRDASGSSILVYPWVLDPLNPEQPATRGFDRKNNVEQVRIPAAQLAQAILPGSPFTVCVDFSHNSNHRQPFTLIVGDGTHFGVLCGNHEFDSDVEECDDSAPGGTVENRTCSEFGSAFNPAITPLAPFGKPRCSKSCRIDLTTCVSPNCGNGVVDAGELCDSSAANGACFRPGARSGTQCADCYPPEAGPIRACRPRAFSADDCLAFGSDLIFVANKEVCVSVADLSAGAPPAGGQPPPRRGCRTELEQDPETFMLYPRCRSKEDGAVGGSCSTNSAPGSNGAGTCQIGGGFWLNSCGCR